MAIRPHQLTDEERKTLTYAEAEACLINSIYEAAAWYEALEFAGKVRGNGHHMAQALCREATKILKAHWNE